MRFVLIALVLAVLMPIQAESQVSGARTKSGCVRVGGKSQITVTGKLTVQIFPGPPNYESVAAGDAEERPFIVELPARTCVDDGGNFADPQTKFDRVQVSSSDPALIRVFRAALGKSVAVTGEGFGAETGHHHAPLVVMATRVTVR